MRIKFKVLLLALLVAIMSVPGVFATWKYTIETENYEEMDFGLDINEYQWVAPSTANTVVYITNVEKKGGVGSVVINGYDGTYLSSSTTLTGTVDSSLTLSVTVFNSSTTDDYAFNAVKYIAEQYDNTSITFTLIGLTHGDRINSGEYLTFDVTFSYVSGANRSDTILNSVLNFEFIVAEELPEEEEIAVSGALDQFENIINNVVRDTSYNELISQMDKYNSNDRHDSSYIGNVVGASNADDALLADLFQGNLKMIIDGEETPVTVLIKRENVDGNSATGDENGNEMTIYLTTDPLEKTSWWGTQKAVVYAAVFTSNNDGEEWYQLGDMYKGQATIVAYNGNPFGDGSFDTDSWATYGHTGLSNKLTIKQVIATLK